MTKISGAMITFEEQSCIRRALESLQRFCDEIVIVDSMSKDSTVDIANDYGCTVHRIPLDTFVNQRNRAVELCSNEWVFTLDADEYCSNQLIKDLPDMIIKSNEDENGADLYEIPLVNYIDGKRNGKLEWKNRFFKKTVKYEGSLLHEIARGSRATRAETNGFIIHDKTFSQQVRSNRLYYYIDSEAYSTPPDGADKIIPLSNKIKKENIHIYNDILSKRLL